MRPDAEGLVGGWAVCRGTCCRVPEESLGEDEVTSLDGRLPAGYNIGRFGAHCTLHTNVPLTMFALATRRSATFLPRVLSLRLMSTFGDNCPLILSPRQLSDLDSKHVSVLDASWHMPNSPRKAREEFLKRHIPGAQYLDLDEVASEHELGLKHMMPSPERFAEACGMLSMNILQ